MPSKSQTGELVALARARFGELSAAEEKLLRGAPKGEGAICGPNLDPEDAANDPAKAEDWGADREIRASLIRWMCVDPAAREQIDPRGIQAFGAKIVEKLDLIDIAVPFRLALVRCRLTDDAKLHLSNLIELNLEGTWVGSLDAERIQVKGSVFFDNLFRAEGEVRLLGAEIGGNLHCSDGLFAGPSETALNGECMQIKGSVFLDDHFRAKGEVRLLGAQIGSNLECNGGLFLNPSEMALVCDGTSVNGDVFLGNSFRAEGEVRLPSASIKGNVDCSGGEINGKLIAQGLSVGGALIWREIAKPSEVSVNLMNATVGALADDVESWPPPGGLVLDGFSYGRISAGPKNASERLKWLARQQPFAPQPYRQLAKFLREEGDDAGARWVLFEMERLRRQKEDRDWLDRASTVILKATIGFGHYPLWSILWLLAITFLWTVLFAGGFAVGSIAPADKDAYGPFKQQSELPPHYERFQPFVYAVEHSIPLVKLGQADRWQPDPNPKWQCSPTQNLTRHVCWILSPVVLRFLQRIQIGLGWFFTTMFVAGVTGIVRKD